MLREMVARYERPAMLWAGGKDSTVMLHLARAAFLGDIPFPIVFIDTGWQFRETYEYIDEILDRWNLRKQYIVLSNREARIDGVSPETVSSARCCTYLKTAPLRDFVAKNNIDALAVGIRFDEHGLRGKEMWFSERRDPQHTRVHPILHWSLEEIWEYVLKHDVPMNPLYKRMIPKGEDETLTYKSIGCYPCTEPVPYGSEERAGRRQDKDKIMERLRALGYM